MNVASFPSSFYPHTGGVEEMCRQSMAEFRRRGLNAVVLTNRWPRSLPRFEEVEGIPVHRLAMRVAMESLKSKVSAALTGRLVRRRMAAELRKFSPDVLHVHCVSVNAVYALAAQAALRVPLVVTLHGELTMDATQLFQRSAWAKDVLRKSLEQADAITACSRQTLEEAELWFGKPFGDRGSVIYNGIAIEDAKAEPYSHPRPYVLAIGRHVPQKGFDLLLRAFAKCASDPGFDHDLILAGDGTEHESLKSLAGALGLGDRVKFSGRVDHATAMKLFAGCSFFVLPSRHEPFGIVNLEAMAAGKAVIATRVGGVPEIVSDDVNGLLVLPEDVDALTGAILRLAGDGALRSRLGNAGLQQAGKFGWPAIAEQYEAIYRQVIPSHKAKPDNRLAKNNK